jgi:hypothetical protein
VTDGLRAPNYRGALLPKVLGFALFAGGAASAVAVSAFDHVSRGGRTASLGALLVTAAGAVDFAATSGRWPPAA